MGLGVRKCMEGGLGSNRVMGDVMRVGGGNEWKEIIE
jgi:hypothetical protein